MQSVKIRNVGHFKVKSIFTPIFKQLHKRPIKGETSQFQNPHYIPVKVPTHSHLKSIENRAIGRTDMVVEISIQISCKLYNQLYSTNLGQSKEKSEHSDEKQINIEILQIC